MRKLLYTALALFTIGGCAGNDSYEGRIVDKSFWQDKEGHDFYRLVVDTEIKPGRYNPGGLFEISFNIEGDCTFLDSLNREFNSGDRVRVEGKDLSGSLVFNREEMVCEPVITSDRLTKVN